MASKNSGLYDYPAVRLVGSRSLNDGDAVHVIDVTVPGGMSFYTFMAIGCADACTRKGSIWRDTNMASCDRRPVIELIDVCHFSITYRTKLGEAPAPASVDELITSLLSQHTQRKVRKLRKTNPRIQHNAKVMYPAWARMSAGLPV